MIRNISYILLICGTIASSAAFAMLEEGPDQYARSHPSFQVRKSTVIEALDGDKIIETNGHKYKIQAKAFGEFGEMFKNDPMDESIFLYFSPKNIPGNFWQGFQQMSSMDEDPNSPTYGMISGIPGGVEIEVSQIQ